MLTKTYPCACSFRKNTNLEKTLNWIEKLKPKKAILTNMHNDLDYEAIKQETPENVEPAHDGLIINI